MTTSSRMLRRALSAVPYMQDALLLGDELTPLAQHFGNAFHSFPDRGAVCISGTMAFTTLAPKAVCHTNAILWHLEAAWPWVHHTNPDSKH